MRHSARAAIFLAAIVGLPAAANAIVTVNINEVGGNVIATASGTLDLTGLTFVGDFGLSQQIQGSDAYVGVGSGSVDGYSGLSGPAAFGAGGPVASSISTGDGFGLNGSLFGIPYVFVPDGYVSGAALLSSATWSTATFASLGLTPGQYIYTGDRLDSVIINIGPGGVPEPTTWAMMLIGFGAIGFAMRRGKRAAALPA
jgi:hypothetical protein